MNVRGTWWIPGGQARRLHGHLTFNADVQLLEVDDSFVGPIQFALNRYPVVHGVTQDGVKVTLLECIIGSTTMRLSMGDEMGHTSKLNPQFVIAGGHLSGLEDIPVTELSFSFDGLASWIGRVGITLTLPATRGGLPLSLSYDKLELPSANCESYCLSLKSTMNCSCDSLTYATIREKVRVDLEFRSGQTLRSAVERWLHPLQIFFSLALSQPCQARDISFRTEETGKVDLNLLGPTFLVRSEGIEESRLLSEKMLLRLSDIEQDFQTVIATWFKNYYEFEPVFSLYFGVVSSTDMFVDHRFLSLIQALEAFHRRFGDDLFISPDEYQAVYESLVSAIPTGLPGDLRMSLKNRLKFGNEVSLRRRMRELLRSVEQFFPFQPGEAGKFVNRVVDVRNHLTHQPDTDFSVDAKELFILANSLRHVLAGCC